MQLALLWYKLKTFYFFTFLLEGENLGFGNVLSILMMSSLFLPD